MKRILVIGATSLIASQCARIWASQQADLLLVARNAGRLRSVADDLLARGARSATCLTFEAADLSSHTGLMQSLFEGQEPPDITLVAHGELPDEAACDADPARAVRQLTVNATSTIALVSAIAGHLKLHGKGTIAVVSSVAGDRGRASNAHYGAAKAAVTVFCDGLRARLRHTGVHIMTVKPGMVATPMTAGLSLPAWLVADPTRVARDICHAIDRRRAVVYTPWWWRWVMGVIRLVPEPLFVRLRL
jgi:short-subunit dehydrogenase